MGLYRITNIPKGILDAKQLLKLNREHWHSENRLHYRREVPPGEDAPEVFAARHGGLLPFLDFWGVKNGAKFLRDCCAIPMRLISLFMHERENG